MAKSKQQKREEAVRRNREGYLKYAMRDWLRAAAPGPHYDAEHAARMFKHTVNSAYAAHCDIRGNYLDERYYCRAGLYDFISSDDPAQLAFHNKLYSLEDLKNIKHTDGRTLFKIAYGTAPFVEKAEPYFEQHKGDFTDIDNIPVIPTLPSGGLRRGDLLVMGAITPHRFLSKSPFSFKSVIDSLTIPPEPPEDPNRVEMVMETVSTFGNQEVFDYLAGRISYQECLSIVGRRAQKTDPNWVPEIDGAALLAFHQKRMLSETYLKIRNRKESGLSDNDCLELINTVTPPVLSPGSKWIADNF